MPHRYNRRAAGARRPRIARGLGWPAVAVIVAMAFAVAAPAVAAHNTRLSRQHTPEATVRDFLTSAVVNNDGFTACRYLTSRARLSFEDNGTDQSCASFFGDAHLTLGGLPVQTNAQLNQLSYRVVPKRSASLVEVSHGGQTISFLVRRANWQDTVEFMNPPTGWRIDSSVASLGPPVAKPGHGE